MTYFLPTLQLNIARRKKVRRLFAGYLVFVSDFTVFEEQKFVCQ